MAECCSGRCRVASTAGVALALAVVLSSAHAHAQLLDQFIAPDVPGTDVQRDVTVRSRLRPEYTPLGVRFGDIMINPELNESAGYDDNATGSGKPHGSSLVRTNGNLGVVYDHSRVSANAEVTVDDNEYFEQPKQSYTNWSTSLGGSYQLGDDTINLTYVHDNLNQTPQDLDVPQLEKALAYRIDQAQLRYRAVFGRLFVVPALTVSQFGYDNGVVGGAVYQQTYRNRIVYNPTLTVGYTFGRYSIVGVLRNAEANYTDRPAGMLTRNFSDVSALGGIDYEATGLLRVRLLAGYEIRSFTSAGYKTISAPIVEASVIWNPTGLTTLTGLASRRIQDSADETTVGLTESALGVQIDHELLRNVLLHGYGSYAVNQYGHSLGSQAASKAGLSANYLLNRNMSLSTAYDLTVRHTSGNISLGTPGTQQLGPNSTDNRVLLQLRLAL